MNDTRAEEVVRLSLQNAFHLFKEKQQELGLLDAAAGDGDHGAAMARGFQAAAESIAGMTDATPGELLVQAGMAFADAGGGASGALFGASMTAVGQKLGGGPFDTAAVAAALRAGLEQVSSLGKAKVGDKTMIDALDPFVRALAAGADLAPGLATAWRNALPAAEAGAAGTANLVAKRGRSSRLGERSLGHVDPGATSMVYLFQAVGKALDAICGESG